MNDLYSILNSLIQKISQHFVDSNESIIDRAISKYIHLSNNELKNEIRTFTENKYHEDNRFRKQIGGQIFKFINSLLLKKSARLIDIELIAIATEAFKREPADLKNIDPDKDYFLYRQQIAASIALTQKCIIQMNTGEGKTYAILPAAFSLACKYHQVYIVCANEYLAERDAIRTSNFYNYSGLSVGLGLSGNNHTAEENWSCRVVYTTLKSIIFKYLSDQLSIRKPKYPLRFNAIIIDEADAVLLDQAKENYAQIDYLDNKLFEWNETIEIAKLIEIEKHITVDHYELTASLTIEGEKILKDNYEFDHNDFSKFLLIRKSVEIAFIALNIVEKDKDYKIIKNRIYSFDKISGKVNYNSTPNWLIPLSYLHNCEIQPDNITLSEINPVIFIKKYKHISGLSGTIKEDALEYFFSYYLTTIIIPPRKLKFKNGLKNDIVYATKAEVYKFLPDKIEEYAIEKKQPILVGVKYINDQIEDFYTCLKNNPKLNHCSIELIRGDDDENIAKIFENAGKVNSIVITTHIGGRGVDIRLTEEARKNGGLALFSIEHAQEIRHDKQFLGRAGRQGDPYIAYFYVSLEDDLLRLFGSENISKIMSVLGLEEGEVIQHSMITKSIIRAQNKVRKNEFLVRRSSDYLNISLVRIYESIDRWFSLLKINSEAFNSNNEIDEVIVKKITHEYYYNFIEILIHKKVDYKTAQNIYNRLTETLNFNFDTSLKEKITDISPSLVKEYIISDIINEIKKINNNNNLEIQEYLNFSESYFQFSKKFNKLLEIGEEISKILLEESNSDNQEIIDCQKYLDYKIQNTEDIDEYILELNLLKDTISEGKTLISDKPTQFGSDLLKKLEVLKQDFEELTKYVFVKNNYENSLKKYNRTYIDIIHWSVKQTWINFLIEKHRESHKVNKQTDTLLDYNRLLSERINTAWVKEEKNLTAFILSNLLKAGEIDQLDTLFKIDESHVDYNPYKQNNTSQWETLKTRGIKKENINFEGDDYLINEFINLNIEDISDEVLANRIKHSLKVFLTSSPISTLQKSIFIQDALEHFYNFEITNSVSKERRKLNHFWLKKFLIHLNRNNYIASLPGLHVRIKKKIKDFYDNIIDIRTAIPLLQSIAAVLFITLFSIIGDWGTERNLNGLFKYLDIFLAYGLFSAGIITSPIFFTAIINEVDFKSRFIHVVKLIIIIALIAFLIWDISSFWSVVKMLFLIPLIAYLIFFTINTINQTKKILGVSLVGLWLLFSISMAFLSVLKIASIVELMYIFIIGSISIIWFGYVNIKELFFASSRLIGSVSSMKNEIIKSGIAINLSSGSTPFLYAMFVSIIINGALHILSNIFSIPIENTIIFYATLASYITIMVLLSRSMVKLKLSKQVWQNKMNKESTIMVHEQDDGELIQLNVEQTLDKIKKQYLIKEFMFQAIIILLTVIVFDKQLFLDTKFPLGLLVTTITILLFELLHKNIKQIKSSLFNRVPLGFELTEISPIEIQTEPKTFKEKIKDFFEPTNSLAKLLRWFIAIGLLVKFIIDFIEKVLH